MIFENKEGYVVQELPFATWVGSKLKAVDFDADEKRRLTVAVKDNSKDRFNVSGFTKDDSQIDFDVEAIELKLRAPLSR